MDGQRPVDPNTGNVTLHGITVNDTETTPATQSKLSAITCPSATLAPGATENCTATYTVTQADLDNGSVSDTATASGTAPGATVPVTSGSSGLTVTATQHPAVTLMKTANITSYSAPGTTVTYSYKVTNSGNVTLSSIKVTDPMSGLSAINCGGGSSTISTLAPGASVACTATYTTTWADVQAGSIKNTGKAAGTFKTTNVTATSSVTVPAASCGPGLTTYFITATSRTGNFTGVFCVNGSGTGTYTQYSPGPTVVVTATGTGTVKVSGATTWIAASGRNLALLGQKTGSKSAFVETAPDPDKAGTFTVTKIS